jgi:hypothetical protein
MSSTQKKFCDDCGKELVNYYEDFEIDDDICRQCFYWLSEDNYKLFLDLVALGAVK